MKGIRDIAKLVLTKGDIIPATMLPTAVKMTLNIFANKIFITSLLSPQDPKTNLFGRSTNTISLSMLPI